MKHPHLNRSMLDEELLKLVFGLTGLAVTHPSFAKDGPALLTPLGDSAVSP